jgi:hypothetical protein
MSVIHFLLRNLHVLMNLINQLINKNHNFVKNLFKTATAPTKRSANLLMDFKNSRKINIRILNIKLKLAADFCKKVSAPMEIDAISFIHLSKQLKIEFQAMILILHRSKNLQSNPQEFYNC